MGFTVRPFCRKGQVEVRLFCRKGQVDGQEIQTPEQVKQATRIFKLLVNYSS